MPQMVREREEASTSTRAALSFSLPPHIPAAVGANFEDSTDDPVIGAAIATLNRAKSDAELMLEAAKAGMSDTTRTLDARHIAVKNSTEKASATVTRSLQAALDRVGAEIIKAEKLLQGPPAPSDAKGLAICLGLQRLSDKDRRAQALECIKSGDEAAAAAILHSSRLATGFTPAELAEVRAVWQHSRYPDETRRLASLKDAKSHIEAAGVAFNGWWSKLYSRAVVAAAEERAAKANAMLGAA